MDFELLRLLVNKTSLHMGGSTIHCRSARWGMAAVVRLDLKISMDLGVVLFGMALVLVGVELDILVRGDGGILFPWQLQCVYLKHLKS